MSEREGKSPLINVGIAVFAVGLVVVAVVFALFASGLHDLPLWLMIAAGVLTPIGMAIGLVGLVLQHRRFARKTEA